MKIVDITGVKFGRLLAIKKVGIINNGALWACKCDCGNEKNVSLQHLRNGDTQSCGCLAKERASIRGKAPNNIGDRMRTHGDRRSKLYNVWSGMKRRCNNKNSTHYNDYGGRGIKVCESWNEYINFKEWAVSNGYEEGLTIERVDVNKNYEPDNCKWATWIEQQNNKRNTKRYLFEGEMYTLRQLSEMSGINKRTLAGRLERGWPVEKIMDKEMHVNKFK